MFVKGTEILEKLFQGDYHPGQLCVITVLDRESDKPKTIEARLVEILREEGPSEIAGFRLHGTKSAKQFVIRRYNFAGPIGLTWDIMAGEKDYLGRLKEITFPG